MVLSPSFFFLFLLRVGEGWQICNIQLNFKLQVLSICKRNFIFSNLREFILPHHPPPPRKCLDVTQDNSNFRVGERFEENIRHIPFLYETYVCMQDITCYMLKYKKFACHHVFLQGRKLYSTPVFPLEDVYKEGMFYSTRFFKKNCPCTCIFTNHDGTFGKSVCLACGTSGVRMQIATYLIHYNRQFLCQMLGNRCE